MKQTEGRKSEMMIDSIYDTFLEEHQTDYDLDFAKKDKAAAYDFIDSLNIDSKVKSELIEKVVALYAAYERQGFYLGFVQGLDLQKDCDNLK